MTVGQLREHLSQYDDDLPILVADYSFNEPNEELKAEDFTIHNTITQDYLMLTVGD